MRNEILNAALEYVDMGFSVIPVKQDKTPCLPSWKEFQTRLPTRDEVEKWWAWWPNANVAIITGQISGIYCVDSDGPAGETWIETNLPKTTVLNRTYRSFHHLYRPNGGPPVRNKVRLAPEVDIRGEGGYFIAPPSVHASGHVYKWEFRGNGWEDLPEYKFNDNAAGSSSACGNLRLDLSLVSSPVTLESVPKGERNNALARLAGRWAGKGMEFEECLMLAQAWNAKNKPPLGAKELERTVKSICETHLRNNGSGLEDAAATGIPDVPDENRLRIPSDVLEAGGLLQDLMWFMEANSAANIPMFALAAALPLVGTLIGQKFMTETGLRTNIYSISLGYSGTGKNSPHTALPNLLVKTLASALLGPTHVTSDAAIHRWLADEAHRNTIMFWDEFGHVLKGIKHPQSVSAQIPALLTKLFSGSAHGETKTYAGGTTIFLPWHHLSFYATSTPERFWEGLTTKDFADGFLARALIFETKEPAPVPKATVDLSIPPGLIAFINDLAEIPYEWDRPAGNLAAETAKIPVPRIIPKTSEAMKLFAPWSTEYHEKKNSTRMDENGLSAIYARAAEHASKLALIHAASIRGSKVQCVDEKDIQWAMRLVDFLVENVVEQLHENVACTFIEDLQKKILRFIKRRVTEKKPGIVHRDLYKQFNYIKSRDLQDAVSLLFKSEQIFLNQDWKPSRGPKPPDGLICLKKKELAET